MDHYEIHKKVGVLLNIKIKAHKKAAVQVIQKKLY